jgi:fructose/tagatose bisphosphate aldolase
MLSAAQIVQNAFRQGAAVPAFNVPYLPMVEPIIRAVADQDSFALIEVARLEWIKFEAQGPEAVMAEFQKWQRPEHVRLHLDHIPVIDEDNLQVDYLPIIQQAIELGYHSVMIDGSRLELSENIAATRRVVELAHQAGIACEAELGAVLGHEDGPLLPYEELFATGRGFTRIDEAERFAHETGCDWLSVAIGSFHGAVSGALKDRKKVAARLNLDHLEKLREVTGIPLVLHGGSGVRQADVLAAFAGHRRSTSARDRQAYETALRQSGQIGPRRKWRSVQRMCWLIRDYFGLAVRALVAG